MSLLAKQITHPDYLTGEVTLPRRLRLSLRLHEWLGQHTVVPCHRHTATGLLEALTVCLSCGVVQTCADAQAAHAYELLESKPPRLRRANWQPRSAAEAARYLEERRLNCRTWQTLELQGLGVIGFFIGGWTLNFLIIAVAAVVWFGAAYYYRKFSKQSLNLIFEDLDSLQRKILEAKAALEAEEITAGQPSE